MLEHGRHEQEGKPHDEQIAECIFEARLLSELTEGISHELLQLDEELARRLESATV
jgi:hypothetical protein